MKCLVRDIPVHYEEFGTGRPLLTLHGMPADHRYMTAALEPLFDDRSGWRRLYPDLPGMGQTPGVEWITRQDEMLEVVMGFMDAVAPGERFVVAGVSYDGYLAQGLLHQRQAQIDGVLMIVPAVDWGSETQILPPHQVIVASAEVQASVRPEEQWLGDFMVVQDLDIL